MTDPARPSDNAPSPQPEALLSLHPQDRRRAVMIMRKPLVLPRILVTGSRHWPSAHEIWTALDDQIRERGQPVIVHGACPTGADFYVRRYAGLNGWDDEPHPADWRKYGKKAGPIRNQLMVDLGADVCLAFPLEDSVGTYDCMRRAARAGIPVINCSTGPSRR